jgi:hypothetical protein
MERSGKQELLTAQRNSAAEKKRLENVISHLESRIAMLEDVINNPDEPTAADIRDGTAVNDDATSPVRSSPAVDPESAAITSNASSPDDGSPLPSPPGSAAAQLILQLQEENQKLADSKLSAQLK